MPKPLSLRNGFDSLPPSLSVGENRWNVYDKIFVRLTFFDFGSVGSRDAISPDLFYLDRGYITPLGCVMR